MNNRPDRKRLLWFAAIGGVVLAALLFVSMMAPSAHPGEESPILRPQTTAAGSSATDEQLTGRTTVPAEADTGGGGGFSLSGGEAVSLAWRLALAAVIIGVSIVGLRWWGKRTQGPRSTTGFIRVVDTLAISNGRTIHLVALGDRVIAVGATTQQLTLLNELTDEEAADVLTATPANGNGQQLSTFAAELFASMRRMGSEGRSTGTRREAAVERGERAEPTIGR